jgi:translation initiation factor 1 (eIF-1/SUI1)
MSEILNKQNTNNTIGVVSEEKKKIEFKSIKEKKCTRTYILNLEQYIGDNDMESVLKDLKKNLGTSCVKKETEFGMGYGFSGDFKQRIVQYLIEKRNVPKESFK